MSINFLIKNSDINKCDNIDNIMARITSCLGDNVSSEIILKSNNYYIEKIGENVYIECYKINAKKEYNNEYFANILNISENEKNKLVEVMGGDRLYEDNLVVLDLLSHKFIKEEFRILLELEQNLKTYFVLSLLKEYGDEAYEIIDSFKTKDDLIKLPPNVKNNIQKIELLKIIEFIIEKPLGGKEYKIYYEEYCNNKDNLLKMCDIFKKNIFSELKNDLNKNKNKIKEYRNILCHNRFLNCEKIKSEHCEKIKEILEKVKKENDDILKELMCSKIDKDFTTDNKQRMTLILKYKKDKIELEIFIIKILAELGYIYDKDKFKINEDELYEYTSENKDLNLKIKKINESAYENIYILDIYFDLYKKNNKSLNEILIHKLPEFDIIICFDTISIINSLLLSDKLSILENLLRKYISIFQYIEEISNNHQNDEMVKNLRIGYNGVAFNKVYDYNFDELIKVITSPNTGKKIGDLQCELRNEAKNNNSSKIEILLNNMLEYNKDLKVIISNWCDLYKYRTRIAHCQIIFDSELKKIKNTINTTKVTIENILAEYLSQVCEFEHKSLNINEKIKIEKNIKNDYKLDLVFTKNDIVYRIENLFVFRINAIINAIINNKEEEYVYSLEILREKINKNIKKINKFIDNQQFEEYISKILEELELCNYADFRIISNEQQKLEEKIGKLLCNIDKKKNKMQDNQYE